MAQDNAIFKGDNTGAFGNNFITITVSNPDQEPISKILFIVNGGSIIKEFTDENHFISEEIILHVNFSSEETNKLNATNVGNLVAYDMQNRQSTCSQSLSFTAKNGVICKNAGHCC